MCLVVVDVVRNPGKANEHKTGRRHFDCALFGFFWGGKNAEKKNTMKIWQILCAFLVNLVNFDKHTGKRCIVQI